MPGQPRQPTSPAGGDIAAIAAKYGLDPAQLVGSGGGSSDDPLIYQGQAPRSFDTELGRFHPTSGHKTTTLSDYSKQFYSLDKTALQQFQTRAYKAGLYGNSKPRLGDYDDDTYKLWQDVGVRAARFYAAGQTLTTNDVLDMAIQSTPPDETKDPFYATRTDVVRLQDPASVREAAHKAFRSVTGKGGAINDKKVQKFVDTFLSAQLGAQRSVNEAQNRAEATARAGQATINAGGTPTQGPLSQEVQLTEPDLASRAQEFAASTDPSGAAATKVMDKFGSFIKMLGGIV